MAAGQCAVGHSFHPTPHLLHAILTKFSITLYCYHFFPSSSTIFMPSCILFIPPLSSGLLHAHRVLHILSDSCFVVGETALHTQVHQCHFMTHRTCLIWFTSSTPVKLPLFLLWPGGKRNRLWSVCIMLNPEVL